MLSLIFGGIGDILVEELLALSEGELVFTTPEIKDLFVQIKLVYVNEKKRQYLIQMETDDNLDK